MIEQFVGEYAFLSNFHCEADGLTVEHRFQAAKTDDPAERDHVLTASSPNVAKSRGRRVKLRAGWDDNKISVMHHLLRQKFKDPELRAKLVATGDQELQEGNYWNDTYWGVSLRTHEGHNHLGKLLQVVRAEIAQSQSSDRQLIVEIAQLWPGHEGVNYETTTNENLLKLIADAVKGDFRLRESMNKQRR